jgi:hypothetical protein
MTGCRNGEPQYTTRPKVPVHHDQRFTILIRDLVVGGATWRYTFAVFFRGVLARCGEIPLLAAAACKLAAYKG